MDVLMSKRRNRLQLLKWQLILNQQHNIRNMLMIQVEVEQRRVQAIRRKKRSVWIRPWLRADQRLQFGHFSRLMEDLRVEDVKSFKNFLRLEPQMFDELVERVGPRIWRQDTTYRKALTPGLKMAITLRYLASGDSYMSLMYNFRVPINTISIFVPEVCEAIQNEYAKDVIQCPSTPAEWRNISARFASRWNFQNCVGALDGKHIALACPAKSGSIYYNYKKYFSIILMALVDADYKFTWVDVGSDGSSGDAQVFNNSEVKHAIENNTIGFPDPEPLSGDDKPIPHFIVGDDAFALQTWLMKPYPSLHLTFYQRIFNYRLSRARRIVENAFGILAHRFRCILTTMRQRPNAVTSIVLACVCLHNLMRIRYPTDQNRDLDHYDQNQDVIPGAWRDNHPLLPLRPYHGARQSEIAKRQRDYICAYYNSPAGSVPWQNARI